MHWTSFSRRFNERYDGAIMGPRLAACSLLLIFSSVCVSGQTYQTTFDNARALLKEKRYSEALQEATRASQLDGSQWGAYFAAGTALVGLERQVEAINKFQDALSRAPEQAKPTISQAIVACRQAAVRCDDPWITKAYGAINMPMRGSGSSGDCNIGLYGGATWGAYSDPYGTLKTWVANSKICSDPWIGEAYATEIGRRVNGSGTSGECNIYLYSGGKWSGFPDLVSKIKTYLQMRERQ
jgi:tetratricopeptide (TPR) repeat protein